MGKKKIKCDIERVDFKILSDVCIDCCDFLNFSYVECEDCSVSRLKSRSKRRIKCLTKGKR